MRPPYSDSAQIPDTSASIHHVVFVRKMTHSEMINPISSTPYFICIEISYSVYLDHQKCQAQSASQQRCFQASSFCFSSRLFHTKISSGLWIRFICRLDVLPNTQQTVQEQRSSVYNAHIKQSTFHTNNFVSQSLIHTRNINSRWSPHFSVQLDSMTDQQYVWHCQYLNVLKCT